MNGWMTLALAGIFVWALIDIARDVRSAGRAREWWARQPVDIEEWDRKAHGRDAQP